MIKQYQSKTLKIAQLLLLRNAIYTYACLTALLPYHQQAQPLLHVSALVARRAGATLPSLGPIIAHVPLAVVRFEGSVLVFGCAEKTSPVRALASRSAGA
jgi:hypothetical protein